MHKVRIPINYRPNLTFFYRKERKCWVLEYDIPIDESEIRTRLSLPKNVQSESQVKEIATRKQSDLVRGILTEKEYQQKVEIVNENIKKKERSVVKDEIISKLKDLLDKGVLTKEEYENKINEL